MRLPERVTIVEVGPRDGLQNEPGTVPTDVKIAFVDRLAATGLPVVEATSFVHPKWVPQLADAAEVLGGITPVDGVRYPVLVPNETGLERALARGAGEVAVFGAASEAFSAKNLNRTIDESLDMFRPVVARARAAGVRVRGYVSTVCGCPYQGEVPVADVVRMTVAMLELGCEEISLGDTIGVGTPGQVQDLLEAVTAHAPVERLAVHMHDTYGQGLVNTLAAFETGVTIADSSAGGLGGCPYAPGAKGNLATEDLVYALHGSGVRTGVDLDALVDTTAWMAQQLGRPPVSRVAEAILAKRQR
ncbi:hydroxymethylglutaryl-CoA lyase [Egicoccus sp. AB-alg2]|uniref:hydroxymethylglutaryl-CoA lyase n=1 Tax=Egicoccus sp. AB-alg2 TaxID=3242693 RepID=UPI00359DC5B3